MDVEWATAGPDILLSMLQITIVVGVLYVSLPAGRYRNKLLEKIESTWNLIEKIDTDDPIYANLMRDNSKFSKQHHYIAMWVGELEETDWWKEPVGLNRPYAKTKLLPPIYLLFKINADKIVAALIAALIPVLLNWSMIYCSYQPTISEFTWGTLPGQLWVGGCMVSGWVLPLWHGARFKNSMEYVSNQYRQKVVEIDVR